MQPYEITIEEAGLSFECRDNQHLLAGMATMGKKGIPSGCHGGGCGVCKIFVCQGEYKRLVMSRAHVSEEEEQEGFALACRVIPQSPLTVNVVGKIKKNVLR